MQIQTEAPNSKSSAREFIIAAALVAVVFLAFYPAVHLGFTTYDDPEYVTANPHVSAGLTWPGVKWAFAAHGANWHPVTWLSHILDGQLFGLDPRGHHLENVIWHALNAGLAFLFLNSLTGATGRSAVAALWFGLHPLRVESVAWIAERKDVLSTFFFFLTLLAYVRFAKSADRKKVESKSPEANPRIYYFLTLVLFALGLMAKSMLVTLPCLLLLIDFWPLARVSNRGRGRIILEKIPFFLLAAAMSAIAWQAQYHGTALVSDLPFGVRLENAVVSYARYLGKIFWPTGLSPLYPYPHAWPVTTVCGSILLLAAISVLVFWQGRARPYLAVGWLWFLGALVPVIGLVQVGNQSIADRYTYVPSLGIILAAVWLAADGARAWKLNQMLMPAAALAVSGICFVLARGQIPYWQNSETLFRRAAEVTTNNTLALVGLGDCLAARGQIGGAIREYTQAIAVSPDYFEARNNLGLAYMQEKLGTDAITQFRAAIAARPGAVEAQINLAVALARNGDADSAFAELENVVSAHPENVLARQNLGRLFAEQRKYAQAVLQFKAALAINNDASLRAELAEALLGNGQAKEAIPEFREALRAAPNDAQIHNNLGTALGLNGQLNEAIAEFQQALALQPDFEPARQNLAKALQMRIK